MTVNDMMTNCTLFDFGNWYQKAPPNAYVSYSEEKVVMENEARKLLWCFNDIDKW